MTVESFTSPSSADSILTISDLRLWVNLGVSGEEKSFSRPVSLDVEISFAQEVPAIYSDDIAEAFCYDNAVKKIKSDLLGKSYNLIEHLAYKAAACLAAEIIRQGYLGSSLKIKVTKLFPPLADIHGNVSFSLTQKNIR